MKNVFKKLVEFIKAHKMSVIVCVIALVIVLILGVVFSVKGSHNKKQEVFVDGPKIGEARDSENSVQWPSTTAKYITAVPVDLTRIQSISKYRSCAGHDNSGYSFEQMPETNRSMKHYLLPVEKYQGTLDKVKMFAPFDGKVTSILLEKDNKNGRLHTGNSITLSTPVDENVGFMFAHIYFVKDFKVGDTVKAGELIGYAALGEQYNDFDIELKGLSGKQQIYGSAFDHMTDSVLAEFKKYGITPENMKFTKEYRDANPCNYASQGKNPDDYLLVR